MLTKNGDLRMNLEKLEKLAKLVLKSLSGYPNSYSLTDYDDLTAKFKNLMNVAFKNLSEHEELFRTSYRKIKPFGLTISEARSIILHLLQIIEIEKASETKVKEMKIFEGAEEKLKQAGLSFRKGDYASTLHNLNTALELALKDKLGIPATITKINTSKIIDILIKHKIEPYLYLAEAKKHILSVDNKIKHQGYSPSKVDCINAIKAMEELISKLRSKDIKISEDIRNKIYEKL